jgi:hypothetical protein
LLFSTLTMGHAPLPNSQSPSRILNQIIIHQQRLPTEGP